MSLHFLVFICPAPPVPFSPCPSLVHIPSYFYTSRHFIFCPLLNVSSISFFTFYPHLFLVSSVLINPFSSPTVHFPSSSNANFRLCHPPALNLKSIFDQRYICHFLCRCRLLLLELKLITLLSIFCILSIRVFHYSFSSLILVCSLFICLFLYPFLGVLCCGCIFFLPGLSPFQ